MKKLLSTVCLALGVTVAVDSAPAQAQMGSDPQLGQILWVGFGFCPRGWAPASGQLLPIAQNTALFSLYGTIYGGDGRTTFGLPNLNGRAAIGEGNGPGLPSFRQGQRPGAPENTMTAATMPQHNHTATVNGYDAAASGTTLASNAPAVHLMYSSGFASADTAMNPASVSVGTTGGSLPFNNLSPYLAQYACVATLGTYPSRS